MAQLTYFNFPIQLLDGFLKDSDTCLSNILDYAVYQHSLKLELGSEFENFQSSAKFHCVKLGNPEKAFDIGEELYEKYYGKSPHVGLNKNIFWDYYGKNKTEFEKLCLLAFLALKSIIGDKRYCKTNNQFMFSRMDGSVKSIDLIHLSPEFYPYIKNKNTINYWSNKIRQQLEQWNFVFYGYKIKGFYASHKLSLEELVLIAESKRASNKEKLNKGKTEDARQAALKKLGLG